MNKKERVIKLIAEISHRNPHEVNEDSLLLYDLGIFLEAADDLFYEMTQLNPQLPTDLDLRKYFLSTSPHSRRVTNLMYKVMNRVVGTNFTLVPQQESRDVSVRDMIESCEKGYWTFDQETDY